MRRRRRMDVRLPGGTIARLPRHLDSAQLAALIAQEEQWLARFSHLEEQAHAQLSNVARKATDLVTEEDANGRTD